MTTEIKLNGKIISSVTDDYVIVNSEQSPLIEEGCALTLRDGSCQPFSRYPLPHFEAPVRTGVVKYGPLDSLVGRFVFAVEAMTIVTEKEPEKPMTINGEKLTVQLIR